MMSEDRPQPRRRDHTRAARRIPYEFASQCANSGIKARRVSLRSRSGGYSLGRALIPVRKVVTPPAGPQGPIQSYGWRLRPLLLMHAFLF